MLNIHALIYQAMHLPGFHPTCYEHTPNNVVAALAEDLDFNIRRDYLSGRPMTGAVVRCPGICKLKIQAPAMAVTACTTRLQPVNFTFSEDLMIDGVFRLDRLGFLSYANLLVDDGQERINLISGYSQTDDCVGELKYTAYTLDSAIGE